METKKQDQQQEAKAKVLIWDCGSSLYDSFELKSFKRELDSAIGRTQSMPHLSDSRHASLQLPQALSQSVLPKRPSKISRSLQKFFRAIFQPKPNSSRMDGTLCHAYNGSGPLRLYTIGESPEHSVDYMGHLTEYSSKVGKSTSERFTAASVGISCA